ncbi:zinc-dependent alcohol dehydrogenase [Alloiococcus sp. CFN-8]|uniref:zinc-dependent alcohol dehydrogenase n=1 Tax=Alloiococcus sp. CFN-8 TaxID=3416081 RepID=UPI003CEAAEA2
MKAIVYDGLRGVNLKDVPDPKLEKADDIIIKVTSTSICGSDLHLVNGRVPHTPRGFILGHETMGIVEEIGSDVRNLKKGDRVVVPFPVACGHCHFCNHGQFSQCDNANEEKDTGGYLGYSDSYGGYDGGQAEYLRVPYANVGPVVVPEELEDEEVLFLTDVLPTSLWGVEHGGVKPGDTVVILGCGPIGLLTIRWAARKGAKRIIAVDKVGYRLAHAQKYGGVEVVNFEEHEEPGRYLWEITKGGADVVIDCVGMDGDMNPLEKLGTALRLQGGARSAIEIATQAVRKAGTIMMVGVYGGRQNLFPLGNLFERNITLKMGQCPAQAYIKPILELIQKGDFDARDIITHKLSLDKGEHAYNIFEEKEDNCIKVILKP